MASRTFLRPINRPLKPLRKRENFIDNSIQALERGIGDYF
jgi:hypothetical protein